MKMSIERKICSPMRRSSTGDPIEIRSSFSVEQNESSDRKRTHRQRSNQHLEQPDRTVFLKNIPPGKFTDQELIDLFSPFGQISDIRVFKDHLLVQYQRADQAHRFVEQNKKKFKIRSKSIEILSGDEYLSWINRSSSKEKSSIDEFNSNEKSNKSICSMIDDEPERKRFNHKSSNNSFQSSNFKDRTSFFSSKSSIDSRPVHSNNFYSILTGSKYPKELIDCQILIVNIRQRNYAENIENRLISEGLRTSIRLLREDFTLTEAVENAKSERSLYAIIVMPMHEERRTASFHILYGETEEHRNLALNDGFKILLRNYCSYKQIVGSHRNEINQQSTTDGNDLIDSSDREVHSNINSSRLTINDRFPLSMLLCLLADGRQLTLDEIDRVLVYLLEKKSKMLALPDGTLPPLPVQYANKSQSKSNSLINEIKQEMISNDRLPVNSQISSENTFKPLIVEQIRQILSSNKLNNINEMKSSNETTQKTFQLEQTKTNFSQINEPLSVNSSSNNSGQFNRYSNSFPSMSCQIPGETVNSVIGTAFSSIQSTNQNLNGRSSSTDLLYSNTSTANLYPFPLSSSQLDSIYHSYSQLNPLAILSSSTLNQTLFNSQQQAKQEN